MLDDTTASMGDLGIAADQQAAQDPTAAGVTDATLRPAPTDPEPPHGDPLRDEIPGRSRDAASPLGDPARRDPSPDAVPGGDDAGARGRDREHGGWGDRGVSGGRAGGTGG